MVVKNTLDFPDGSAGKESACKTWVQSLGWKDPLRREKLSTLVFWPGEFHELYSPWGLYTLYKEKPRLLNERD